MIKGVDVMNIMEKTLSMLKEFPLCDHCLGRQFALLGHGIENYERGVAVKTILLSILMGVVDDDIKQPL